MSAGSEHEAKAKGDRAPAGRLPQAAPLRLLTLALFAFPLAALAGCTGGGPEPVPLVLISPHSDAIREEVGRAFPEWFQARTRRRLAEARTALAAIYARSAPTTGRALREVVAGLYRDWSTADLGPVGPAYAALEAEPTPGRAAALRQALDDWEARLPPVELVWQDIGGGTSQIVRYVAARFAANPEGIGIDLLFGGGTETYLRFADQGLLERVELPPALLAHRIPAQLGGVPLYDPQGRWYGPILSGFGILSNREVLRRLGQPEPRHWADLGEPGLFGWVGAGDPRMTGSVHLVYEIILQGHGWDEGFGLLLRLGANTHAFLRDSGTLTRLVTEGEDAAAGNLDGYALTAVGRHPEFMSFCLPAGETAVNADALAVLKGAPRKELARAFIQFTLSDAGQLLFLLRPGEPGGPHRYPLCRLSVVESLYERYPPEVRSVGAANPFRTAGTLRYNGELGNRRWDALNDLFGAFIIDAHGDLAAARQATLRMRDPEARRRLEAELFAPPCTEAELLAHARAIVEAGPRVRTATVNRWGEQARARYRRIRRLARQG